MKKPIFSTSDATITSAKVELLIRDFRKTTKKITEELERIQVEVDLLRDANHAMTKTIRESRYASPG